VTESADRQIARQSRAAQGLPPFIEDPLVLDKVAALLVGETHRKPTARTQVHLSQHRLGDGLVDDIPA
jgi:hypothetical protein